MNTTGLVKVFALLLIGMSILAFNLQRAESSGSSATKFNKNYGGAKRDEAYSVIQTSDGGYALAGFTDSYGAGGYDFYLVKTDANGNYQWFQYYGGVLDEEAHCVIQTSDGGYVLAGYTESYGAGLADFWLVKTDATGNALWNQTYGGPKDDIAYSVVQTSDGGYVLAGYTESYGAGLADFWLVKTDATGTELWNQTYGGRGSDEASSLVKTSDGGYALAGFTGSYGVGNADFWLVKTDATGTELWNQTYGGVSTDIAYSVIQTSDGGYVLAGYTESFGAGGDDFWLVKTYATGNELWNQTYGGGGSDVAYSVIQTSDGGYVLAGYTESYGVGGSADFGLVKTSVDGSELWSHTFGGPLTDIAYCVIQTSDGGYALAGYTESYGAGSADMWLVKTDETGVPEFSSFSILLLLLVASMFAMVLKKKGLTRRP
ncbi:MAG: hypothetical protein ABSC91_03335 [Candidatus Bathyarchaeia archaeon]